MPGAVEELLRNCSRPRSTIHAGPAIDDPRGTTLDELLETAVDDPRGTTLDELLETAVDDPRGTTLDELLETAVDDPLGTRGRRSTRDPRSTIRAGPAVESPLRTRR